MSTAYTVTAFGNTFVNLVRSDQTSLAVVANTNIFATDFAPASKADPVVLFIIYVVPQLAGTFGAFRTTSGTATNKAENFFVGGSLKANAGYIFPLPVGQNDTINFQYSVTTTFTKFMLIEVP